MTVDASDKKPIFMRLTNGARGGERRSYMEKAANQMTLSEAEKSLPDWQITDEGTHLTAIRLGWDEIPRE